MVVIVVWNELVGEEVVVDEVVSVVVALEEGGGVEDSDELSVEEGEVEELRSEVERCEVEELDAVEVEEGERDDEDEGEDEDEEDDEEDEEECEVECELEDDEDDDDSEDEDSMVELEESDVIDVDGGMLVGVEVSAEVGAAEDSAAEAGWVTVSMDVTPSMTEVIMLIMSLPCRSW